MVGNLSLVMPRMDMVWSTSLACSGLAQILLLSYNSTLKAEATMLNVSSQATQADLQWFGPNTPIDRQITCDDVYPDHRKVKSSDPIYLW